MTGTIAGAISDEQILGPNSLASVTPNFIIVRNSDRQAFTIIPISRLSRIRFEKRPYPGFLVVAGGLFVLAAAAFFSKEGDGAAFPAAFLGTFLLIIYFATRRASVIFILDSGAVETVTGNITEAAALVDLVQSARK